MTALFVTAAIISIGLTVYLFIALLHPERLQ